MPDRSNPLVPHESAEALSAYLDQRSVEHQLVEHDAAFTAAGEARAAAVAPHQAAKTIVVEDSGAYMLALVPASERLDVHKLRSMLGAGKGLRLATEDEMAEHFSQFELGAVPPFGDAMFTGEVVDRGLLDEPRIMCSAGDHRHSIMIDPHDVVRLSGAQVGDICAD